MDNQEAADLLEEYLETFRRRAYSDLVSLMGKPQVTEFVGATGAQYQVEVDVHWDDRSGDAVRVVASIDDGGWRAIKPLTADFILAPDGTFVGE